MILWFAQTLVLQAHGLRICRVRTKPTYQISHTYLQGGVGKLFMVARIPAFRVLQIRNLPGLVICRLLER